MFDDFSVLVKELLPLGGRKVARVTPQVDGHFVRIGDDGDRSSGEWPNIRGAGDPLEYDVAAQDPLLTTWERSSAEDASDIG